MTAAATGIVLRISTCLPVTANTIGGGLEAGQAPGIVAETIFVVHEGKAIAGAI